MYVKTVRHTSGAAYIGVPPAVAVDFVIVDRDKPKSTITGLNPSSAFSHFITMMFSGLRSLRISGHKQMRSTYCESVGYKCQNLPMDNASTMDKR
jgi:hypothetical protein